MYKTKQRAFRLFFAVLLVLVMSVSATTVPILAESKIVRIGFFELPGFNEYDDMGNPTGYNIEYLNYMAEHTGWKYEFVKANSWPEALKLLKERKVDLISPSRKTPEREAQFAFSANSFGEEYGSILTLSTNDNLSFEDFSQFSEIKFGCVDTLVVKDDFFLYAKNHDFTPNVTYYKDTNALIAALKVGEVDAIVANLMNAKKDMKVLAKFSQGSFYYMTNKENTALLTQLDNIMEHMKTVHSKLESELVEKYYKFYNSVAYTKQENEYIETSPVFNVGYISDRAPISYVDPKTGEAKGITRDILDKICQISGLKFNYIPLPQGEIKYNYFQENNIHLVSGVEHNSMNVDIKELNLTNPYLNTQKIIVGTDPNFSMDGPVRIALSAGSQTLEPLVQSRYPNAEIVKFKTTDECFDAVLSKKADVLVQNKYAVERILPKPKYEGLEVIPTEFIEDELSLAALVTLPDAAPEASMLADERLMTIINKTIASIDSNVISDIVIKHTVNSPYKFTFSDFYYQYKFFIFALLLCVSAVVFITAHNFKLKATNLKMLTHSENKLKNITNNINGGVVVLLPNKGLEILFANEGFLALMQYSKEEIAAVQNSNYITYVHEDDIELLNNLIADAPVGEPLSVRLRLLKKDNTYVPTLFNGTLSVSDSGQKEMYCVIMDISEQLSMMEQLEQQQSRYEFVIKKSNALIFDIDTETLELSVAENFKREFGWTLPKKLEVLTPEYISSKWHIHSEDKYLFDDVLATLLEQGIDAECKVRIKKQDLTYRWYNVSLNLMKKRDQLIRIIGRVTDVDEEMKEKERLFRQTQLDPLTGLYNKEAFHTLGQKYLREEIENNSAVIFIDLDNFKQINDLLGHMVGDKVIKEAARKLQIIFSHYDLIARFGGDEFCILVKEIPMETLCDKLAWTVEKMKELYLDEDHAVTVTVSVGAALCSAAERDLSRLMLCADKALYSAKDSGKNQYVIYNGTF